MNLDIRELSTGGGCGCKFPLGALQSLFSGLSSPIMEDREDVGILGSTHSMANLACSIDFIQPIVGDEKLYGRVAALHAMNDLFAKGVKPEGALIVLCWPRELIGIDGAKAVMMGIEEVCEEEGVSIVGGHTIDAQNPIVGLAVFGQTKRGIISCTGVQSGDRLFLSKQLGVGISCNAERRGLLEKSEVDSLFDVMASSNRIGLEIGGISGINAMTDVTGFGLRLELNKLVSKSTCRWIVREENLGVMSCLERLGAEKLIDLETKLGLSNRKEFGEVSSRSDFHDILGADPQTNGPLLFSASRGSVDEVVDLFSKRGLGLWEIGEVVSSK